MNSFQQLQMLKPMAEEKDETTTQADTFFGEEPKTFLDTLPVVKEEMLRHHAICGRISEGTFTSDKVDHHSLSSSGSSPPHSNSPGPTASPQI